MMESDESSQPTFMRARSTKERGRSCRERTSGAAGGLCTSEMSLREPPYVCADSPLLLKLALALAGLWPLMYGE
jgi:hypothetical protein